MLIFLAQSLVSFFSVLSHCTQNFDIAPYLQQQGRESQPYLAQQPQRTQYPPSNVDHLLCPSNPPQSAPLTASWQSSALRSVPPLMIPDQSLPALFMDLQQSFSSSGQVSRKRSVDSDQFRAQQLSFPGSETPAPSYGQQVTFPTFVEEISSSLLFSEQSTFEPPGYDAAFEEIRNDLREHRKVVHSSLLYPFNWLIIFCIKTSGRR